MAYKDLDSFERGHGEFMGEGVGKDADIIKLQANGESIDLPSESYVRDADITREGMDLHLEGPDGEILIEGYFAAAETPLLNAPGGATLTPELVESFAKSPPHYANAGSMNDASPVGQVQEISGEATVTRVDGTSEPISIGSPIYQGDVVETAADSAVNIVFSDESSFAVSEDTRLAIDEYVFDPATEGGVQNFSVLKGVFVYTSGLIGREDPDDVEIATPVGSIGIRGTIIAGDVNEGEITVVEGAIVLRDPSGMEITLANQFETGRFLVDGGVENIGQLAANDVAQKFSVVSKVAPTLFSSINDAAAENNTDTPVEAQENAQDNNVDQPTDQPTDEQQDFDADGATDQDGDNEVDGTVEEGSAEDSEAAGEETTGEAPAEAETLVTEAQQGDQPAVNPVQMAIQNNLSMQAMQTVSTALVAGQNPMEIVQQIQETMRERMQERFEEEQQENEVELLDLDDPLVDPALLNEPDNDPDIPRPQSLQGASLSKHSVAPADFFKAGLEQNWVYDFSAEFTDNADSFELSASTLSFFSSSPDVTLNSFADGLLSLTFDKSFTGDIPFAIEIKALNSEGEPNPGGFQTYAFEALDSTLTYSSFFAQNNKIVNGTTGADNMALGAGGAANGNKVFLGDGNDTISIGTTSASGNHIYLGEGENSATLGSGTMNIVYGGSEEDLFVTQGTENTFFGMGGDDVIRLNASSTGVQTNLNQPSTSSMLMDGGDSDFRMEAMLNGLSGDGLGRGDTLLITRNNATTEVLDFTAINDQFIKGIERLELSSTGAADITVKLNYNDIIAMTDNQNTLVIRSDAGNTLDLIGSEFSDFDQIEDDIKLDDNGTFTAGTGDDTTFDVFTDGNVTLIIEDTVSAAMS